ncbi:MAG: ferrous iron transport protein B [Clostridiaceae bacterium]|jgi:ferrous iron transport protein B|nr:ferrous iron transport protein B [Clostridiaceae bacterium]
MEQEQKSVVIALAGNPNSGKTTLFNALTGGNQYVGNWPGVTVEKKEGKIKNNDNIVLQDLPGIYSLSPYTAEEVIARNYLVTNPPDVILNIVDGSNLERNLYLTTQLTELNVPVVVAINMMDQVEKQNDKIDLITLSRSLGCPVIGISALKITGLDELVNACKAAAAGEVAQKPVQVFKEPISKAIRNIESCVPDAIPDEKRYWYAIKLFERDEGIRKELSLSLAKKQLIEKIIQDVEVALDDDAESIVVDARYKTITEFLTHSHRRNDTLDTFSDKIDKVVTNRWLALPVFALVMTLMYYISIAGVGMVLSNWVNNVLFEEWIFGGVSKVLTSIGASESVHSLVVDGVLSGLAAPIGFVPQMALVFLSLGFLQDCGYMARIAFIMDRLFRHFGLSGRSFLSFLVSSGCGVPGIMATRTIANQRDRDMTMITTTAIPCSAKLPVIGLIASYISGAWWLAPLVYFMSIAVVILASIIMKKLRMFAGEPAPFVMELPAYRWPTLKGLARHVWTRVSSFLKRAGTLIFAMSVIMWFLASFGFADGRFAQVDSEQSLLAAIGGAIAWIFIPLGFGNWQSVAATFAGFTAKEAIVSTMGVLAGLGPIESYTDTMHNAFQTFFPMPIAAISFLIFNLFNSPCLGAVATLYREISSKRRFAFAILFQNLGAYAIALQIYQIGGLLIGQVPFSWQTIFAFVIFAITLFLILRPDPSKKNIHSDLARSRT